MTDRYYGATNVLWVETLSRAQGFLDQDRLGGARGSSWVHMPFALVKPRGPEIIYI